jgi:hypothetical protein
VSTHGQARPSGSAAPAATPAAGATPEDSGDGLAVGLSIGALAFALAALALTLLGRRRPRRLDAS